MKSIGGGFGSSTYESCARSDSVAGANAVFVLVPNWCRRETVALGRRGGGHGRRSGKTGRRRHRSLPWRARPGLAARGGGRRPIFHAVMIGPRPIDRLPPPPTAPAAAIEGPRAQVSRSGASVQANDRSRRDSGAPKRAAGLAPATLSDCAQLLNVEEPNPPSIDFKESLLP